MPFRTLHMEGYLRHLKKGNRPASAFTSFQEAVNFAIHVVGVSVAVASKVQQQGLHTSKWLHALLARSGNTASPGTTSHTVKSTVLSWCAKYGMARHPRLQLGHHTSGDGSRQGYLGPGPFPEAPISLK